MKLLSFSLLAAALLTGCSGEVDDTGKASGEDIDGDGYTEADGDCDDGDAQVNPGAAEVWYDGVDQDCDANDDDQDGDGFAVADDCDDTLDDVNPDAAEVCDEVDNNCDGEVDVGGTDGVVVYQDADGDGYGLDGTETTACDVADGWATRAGDCNDAEASAFPGADEVCDNLDNDCDGSINEGNPDEVLYYRDADADGYGNAADSVLSCTTPDGYTADATDCDDAIAIVNPGAEEYCDDTDRDCDGNPTNAPVDGTAFYSDADADGYGDGATAVLACEAVEGLIPDGSDCDDTTAAVNPGAAEVCDGLDNDCSTVADDGLAFSDWYADVDADSYGDADSALTACDQPEGYVADASDCDDADALTFPGGEELCDLEDNDCDGTVDDGATDERTYFDDADADGYGDPDVIVSSCGAPSGFVETGDDCDDANSIVNPGATEACNGLDDNCDSDVDNAAADATAYYRDADRDGYGDAADTTASCDRVSGYVTDATDCDDTSASISPADLELCDGADNDCDGTSDEDDAADAGTWYADADTDGFGDPGMSTQACAVPAGYTTSADDCDDTDARVSPIDTEVCNGVDDNCDGTADESGAVGETTWYADADADTFGVATGTVDACDLPAGYTDNVDDCDDADGTSFPGGVEASDLADNDCDGWVDEDFIAAGDVIFSEVTRQPRFGATATNTNGQWFEVYNASARDIDLSNWYFTRTTTSLGRDGFYVDPASEVIIGAGDYAVFCKTDNFTSASSIYSTLVCDYFWGDETASASYAGTYQDNTFNQQRDQDTLEAYVGGSDTTGALVDRLSWYYDATNGYWPRDATRSMTLDPAALDATSNDLIANWCSNTNTTPYRWYYVSTSNVEYGTPGSTNYDCP